LRANNELHDKEEILMKKKVVHFWNICGIGGLLARYMDRHFDYETVAIDRGHANKYSHNNEKTEVWNNRAAVWLTRCMMYSRKFDIIHVHSGIQWLKWYRMLNPGKPIIIHLHGTKIRGRWGEWPDLAHADRINVPTPDLLHGPTEGTIYLPNPIEEELILKVKEAMKDIPRINKAFHVDRYATDKAQEYADRYGLELVIFDRDETPLPHAAFLGMMAQYAYFINVERSKFLGAVAKHQVYVDVKRDYPGTLYENKILEAWSLTGLEALGLGCKVIDWKGQMNVGLPHEHRSFNIASKLHEVYEGLI
jgi:hypothetical protein